MNLAISWSETTADVSRKESYFLPLQHYLGAWFYRQNYGPGVRRLLIAINCVGHLPGQSGPKRDFATGLLLEKKYYRARQEIIIVIKLNHTAVRRVTTQQAAAAILRVALLRVGQEVRTLTIPAFDCLAWEADLTAQLEGTDWLSGVLPQWQRNDDE